MAVGDLITSIRYNNLQTRAGTIMGVGSGQSGYGQILASAQVIIGSQVTLTQILNLRTDMVKARQHQTGANEGPTGTGGTNAFTLVTTANQVTDAFAANLESQMTTIENNKFAVAANQTSLSTLATSVRTAAWNTQLVHEVTLDFDTANGARHYFNAGGTIHVRATLTGGVNDSIYNDWLNMLVNAGIVIMDHTSTTRTGTSGVGSSIGFYDLTTVNQQIFTKTGSGNYAANDWTIYARKDATGRYVYLRIEFNDDKVGNPNFDEAVTGTLTSIVEANRPSGTNVSVAAPAASTTVGVDSGAQVPTYAVSSGFNIVEGAGLTWNITTTNVVNGTILYYAIIGTTDSADWVGGNTGTVTVNSNAATLTKLAVDDGVYEPTETFSLMLRTGSAAGPIVATSAQRDLFNRQPLGTRWQSYSVLGPSAGETKLNFSIPAALAHDQFANLSAISYIPPYPIEDTVNNYEGDKFYYRRVNTQPYTTEGNFSGPPASWWNTSTPTFTRDTATRYFKQKFSSSGDSIIPVSIATSSGQQYGNAGGFNLDNRGEAMVAMYTLGNSSIPIGTRGTYSIFTLHSHFAQAGSGVPYTPPTMYNGHPAFNFIIGDVLRTSFYSSWGSNSPAFGAGRWLLGSNNRVSGGNGRAIYVSSNVQDQQWTELFQVFAEEGPTPSISAILKSSESSFFVNHIVVTTGRFILFSVGDSSNVSNWFSVDLGDLGIGFSAARSVARNPLFGSATIIVGGIIGEPGRIWRTNDPDLIDGWTQISNPSTNMLTHVIYSGTNEFLAVGFGGNILRSADNGLTWTRIVDPQVLGTVDFEEVICNRNGSIAIARPFRSASDAATRQNWYISRKDPS